MWTNGGSHVDEETIECEPTGHRQLGRHRKRRKEQIEHPRKGSIGPYRSNAEDNGITLM
jgi:hypothetical protein